MSQENWPNRRVDPAPRPDFRNFGPRTPIKSEVLTEPSRFVSAFGSFAIGFVVSRVATIAFTVVLGAAVLASSDSVDDATGHLNGLALAVYVLSTLAAAVPSSIWLSRRGVPNAFGVALLGGTAGILTQVAFTVSGNDSTGGMVAASAGELIATYAAIRPRKVVPRR